MPKEVLKTTAAMPDEAVEVVDNNDGEFLKMSDVADMCGLHRVTLLRMEQKGLIPKAKWAKLPQPHRVYTREEAMKLVALVSKIREASLRKEDREYIDETLDDC